MAIQEKPTGFAPGAFAIYTYKNIFYTGAKTQPDTFSVFLKTKKADLQMCHMRPSVSRVDYTPAFSSFGSIIRTYQAIHCLFSTVSKGSFQHCPNAIKNLLRACVAFVPVAGNLSLFVFDTLRNSLHEKTIANSLKNKKEIIGIAFDGKVIATAPLKDYYSRFSKKSEPIPVLTSEFQRALNIVSKKEDFIDMEFYFSDLLTRLYKG
ncbi:MAG: hypothetical protein V4494_06625 [Chlamydiota bacterium]